MKLILEGVQRAVVDEMFEDLEPAYGPKDRRFIDYLTSLNSEYDVTDFLEKYAGMRGIYILPGGIMKKI